MAEEPLNILVLTVDDMNCDSVGIFGCKTKNTTPHKWLEQLDKESRARKSDIAYSRNGKVKVVTLKKVKN